jgi:MFS family permease
MARRDTGLYIIFLTTLMAVIGVSLISPAFPRIRDELGLSGGEVGLLVTVFTVPGIFFSPVVGWGADRWGRKKLLVASLVLFGISGGSIAAMRSFGAIMALRFIQGCAAAALSTISLALIADLYHGPEQERIMGYNGSVLSIGTASYPAIGGALAGISWHAPFYVFLLALPLGAYVAAMLEDESAPRGTGVCASSWRNCLTARTLLLMMVAIVTFVMLYGSYLTFFPQYLSDEYGLSAAGIGAYLSLMSLSTAIFSFSAGTIIGKLGRRWPVAMAFIFYTLSFILMGTVRAAAVIPLAVTCFGVGQGLNLPSLQVMVLDSVPKEMKASASAMYASTLRIGQSIGPVVMAACYGAGSYALVFACSAALGAVTLVGLAWWARTGSRQ